jgi:hypothetical protein
VSGLGPEWLRLDKVPKSKLTDREKAAALAIALEDAALVQSLQMIHGPEAGMAMYQERLGRVRPDANGNACICIPAVRAAARGGLGG